MALHIRDGQTDVYGVLNLPCHSVVHWACVRRLICEFCSLIQCSFERQHTLSEPPSWSRLWSEKAHVFRCGCTVATHTSFSNCMTGNPLDPTDRG